MARRGATTELAALLASLDLSAFLPAFVEGGRRRGAAGGSAEPGRAEVLAGRHRRPGAGVIRRRRRGAGARTRAQVFLGVLWLDTAGPLAGHR